MITQEEDVLQDMKALLEKMRQIKPNDRSELDRRIAISITDLEKEIAYWSHFVVLGG